MKNQEAVLLLSKDEERLENITSAFVKSVISEGRFEDLTRYKELAKRIAAIIDLEIKDAGAGEVRKLWLNFWGPHAN